MGKLFWSLLYRKQNAYTSEITNNNKIQIDLPNRYCTLIGLPYKRIPFSKAMAYDTDSGCLKQTNPKDFGFPSLSLHIVTLVNGPAYKKLKNYFLINLKCFFVFTNNSSTFNFRF